MKTRNITTIIILSMFCSILVLDAPAQSNNLRAKLIEKYPFMNKAIDSMTNAEMTAWFEYRLFQWNSIAFNDSLMVCTKTLSDFENAGYDSLFYQDVLSYIAANNNGLARRSISVDDIKWSYDRGREGLIHQFEQFKATGTYPKIPDMSQAESADAAKDKKYAQQMHRQQQFLKRYPFLAKDKKDMTRDELDKYYKYHQFKYESIEIDTTNGTAKCIKSLADFEKAGYDAQIYESVIEYVNGQNKRAAKADNFDAVQFAKAYMRSRDKLMTEVAKFRSSQQN